MMKQGYRHLIQAVSALFTNGHLSGFFTGRLYQGAGKHFCVPGLNCYSCPGALGACPIGSLQAVIGGQTRGVSYYVFGLLLLFGTVFGRLICAFLCPFGLIQELLYKIPSPKPRVPRRPDRVLRWGKYVCLAAVLLIPAVWTDAFGLGVPAFCKYLCPAGTLEGGLPLLLTHEGLRDTVGALFGWKLGVLLAVLAACVLLYRPFCKYLCPLGAFYGLFNRVSLYRMEVDSAACTHCKSCERACKMGVEVTRQINSAECIRCSVCRNVCPAHAIRGSFPGFASPRPSRQKGGS